MRRKSIYESYLRIQLEALTLCVLVMTLTLCCLLWSYRHYRQATRQTYVHHRGVTLQVFEDNSKQNPIQPTL